MTADPDDAWRAAFAAVQRFVAARGTAKVPSRAIAYGFAIGAWALEQRRLYWAAQLIPERRRLLEELPDWTWSGIAEQKWHRGLRGLREYAERTGTSEVPERLVADDVRLGEWVAAQRAGHGAGTLPPPLAAALEALPGWRWQPEDDRWDRGQLALHTYVDRTGTADAPRNEVVDGFPLGTWLVALRSQHRAGEMPADRAAALQDLPGWRWSLSEERWEQGLRALRVYVAAEGHACPQQRVVIDGFAVGAWVHARRREYATGTLEGRRRTVLEALPGWRWRLNRGQRAPA
jgi:hypothetical protein